MAIMMMRQRRRRVGLAVVFAIFLSCTGVFSHAESGDDLFESLSILLPDPSFETSLETGPDSLVIASVYDDSTAPDGSLNVMDLHTDFTDTDSSTDLFLEVEPNLLIGSTEACSGDISFLIDDTGAVVASSLEQIGKREKGPACKSPSRDSDHQDPDEDPYNDPGHFLNDLPVFLSSKRYQFLEDKQVCQPSLVGNRNTPVCWYEDKLWPKMSEQLPYGTWHGCSACKLRSALSLIIAAQLN